MVGSPKTREVRALRSVNHSMRWWLLVEEGGVWGEGKQALKCPQGPAAPTTALLFYGAGQKQHRGRIDG